MVFFTCNACGESLKKAQIQKHTSMCRGCQVLSCIDCGKDFWGEDYKSHVKCISEDQKYGGKNYEAKANKGDVKQQQWIQRVQAVLDKPGVSARLRSVLQQVATYDNVPRKKAKFQNWIKNSLKIYDSSLQDQVWEIFSSSESPQDNGAEHPVHTSPPEQDTQEEQVKPEKKKKNKRERKEERQKNGKKKRTKDEQNGENGVEEPQKKKRKHAEEEEDVDGKSSAKMKKRKAEECEESQNVEELEEAEDEQEAQDKSNAKGTFNWKGTIKAILRQAPEEGIALKKLRKKVLSAYYSFSAEDNHKSEEELYSLFNKKLKNPKFKILKEKVRLVK
ncbi:cell growth-regulating nucleolar protein isoform X1 [Tachysurus fulvidraco]|uniref:cell growth-regulating nucleolar protein isoform X1 n=1 Tax=Tachysurus fulvidraco TaxID=1234273 RepID=UPI000F50E4DC|nr:cell growth-regulating nucleolar protein isoform X1 [Tachysurus fulvidraco]XP_047656812.1 cell growth-regulating nucleolar protein isoform X1 [Tachysurus fulvidraco]